MTAFDALHPALQHHIVNTLGWKTLRPLQEDSVQAILRGEHALLLAPTAGGKTEAAVFPLISRLLSANWGGLSVLYLCPIKALLNSLEERLARYCDLVGLRCALWHGDTSDSERRRILENPPQLLLTTPESLEVMLISKRVDHHTFFRTIQAVVVDELHAFAGDDRGWHLLALLERVGNVAGTDLQRVGLSATVGNPDEMLSWLAGSSHGTGTVVAPPADAEGRADVQLDFVGSIENAAVVVSRLHQGEKRLVFCDSRSRVESLAASLRSRGVDTFVSHSSLSAAERKRAEEAFSAGTNCVIVATSTLELGIDVGDLDRVIQIDSPSSVSSFLQRLGRTGRRTAISRNCLFLATHDNALLQAAGLLDLWKRGFVDPVLPPPTPAHIFAQQIMALALQEDGIGRETYKHWINLLPGFDRIPAKERDAILQHMLDTRILTEDQGILWFDTEGEARFGYRNFMELCSVFTSAPLFSVLHGRTPIGFVHEMSFLTPQDRACVLLLGGRSWRVVHLDWQKKTAQVEPAEDAGRSRWLGVGSALSDELSNAMRRVLNGTGSSTTWSKRAVQRLQELQGEYDWLPAGGTCFVESSKGRRWWTFAGTKTNLALANALRNVLDLDATPDALSLRVPEPFCKSTIRELADKCTSDDNCFLPLKEIDHQMQNLKFAACLPPKVQRLVYQQRYLDIPSARRVMRENVSTIHLTNQP